MAITYIHGSIVVPPISTTGGVLTVPPGLHAFHLSVDLEAYSIVVSDIDSYPVPTDGWVGAEGYRIAFISSETSNATLRYRMLCSDEPLNVLSHDYNLTSPASLIV